MTKRAGRPARPTPADLEAVRASLAAVQQRPVQLAEAFYEHLFEMAPSAREMFPDDLSEQMQKMTTALLGVVATLSNADSPGRHDTRVAALERSLRQLGTVHRDRWQVRPEHYLYIPHALTRAVRDVAGAAWCGALSSRWIGLIQWINSHMMVEMDEPTAGSS